MARAGYGSVWLGCALLLGGRPGPPRRRTATPSTTGSGPTSPPRRIVDVGPLRAAAAQRGERGPDASRRCSRAATSPCAPASPGASTRTAPTAPKPGIVARSEARRAELHPGAGRLRRHRDLRLRQRLAPRRDGGPAGGRAAQGQRRGAQALGRHRRREAQPRPARLLGLRADRDELRGAPRAQRRQGRRAPAPARGHLPRGLDLRRNRTRSSAPTSRWRTARSRTPPSTTAPRP